MISLVASCRFGPRASWKVAAVALAAMIGVCGCAGVGVSYEAGGYYGPYDYDYDYDYGPWGPDYYVGPPVIVGGGFGHDHGRGHDHDRGGPGGGGRHYRPAAPSRGVPSIPARARPR